MEHSIFHLMKIFLPYIALITIHFLYTTQQKYKCSVKLRSTVTSI